MLPLSFNRYYVYALICPLNDEEFYIGKGSGDRMYSHAKLKLTDKNTAKKDRIKAIHDAGAEVEYVVLSRHTRESDAYKAESQAIKEIGIDRLTNIAPGCVPESHAIPVILPKTVKTNSVDATADSINRIIWTALSRKDVLTSIAKEIVGNRSAMTAEYNADCDKIFSIAAALHNYKARAA